MRVAMLALPSAENPYLELLVASLAERGVEVRAVPSRAFFLPSVLRGGRPSAVHLHWLHWFYDRPGAFASAVRVAAFAAQLALLRAAGVRVVWTAHNLAAHDAARPRLDRACRRLASRLSSAIIVHCEAAARIVADAWPGAVPKKIHVVPHGHFIDRHERLTPRDEARRRLGLADAEPAFVFFGQIRPYKGVDALLDAFRGAGLEGRARLVVAGRPASADISRSLEQAAASIRGVELRLGFLDDEALAALVAAADAVVLPYRDVLTSGAAVLAASLGRPVIAPRVACLPELLGEESALLYDPERPGALSETLRRAAGSIDELAREGARLRQEVRRHDWRLVAELTVRAYGAG